MKATTFKAVAATAVLYTTLVVPTTASPTITTNPIVTQIYKLWSESSITSESEIYQEEKKNYLYINPELYDLINSKQECYSSKKNFIFHYFWFCSTIGFLKNTNNRYKEKEFVNINYKTMVSIISKHHYSKLTSDLKEWNVIEEDPSYQVGICSKSYRLKSPFNINLVRIPIEDKLINRKIDKFKMTYKKEVEKLPLPYQYLYDKFMDKNGCC